jgi:hypothetical protein
MDQFACAQRVARHEIYFDTRSLRGSAANAAG